MSERKVRAVVFDLFKTLGHFPQVISDKKVSTLLVHRGYEVYPQAFRHAFGFTVFVDYPRYGFKDYEHMFRKMFERIDVNVDEETLKELSKIYSESHFELFPESVKAVKIAKSLGLKTAIATTTPKFWFYNDITPIVEEIDFICTGYEAGYEKSNPKIYQKIMETLTVEPWEAVVIGDNLELDIRNPKSLGMIAIHININQNGENGIADATVKNVLEAMKMVESWILKSKPL